MPATIAVKRAYEPAAPADGRRFLVDRVWPRGVSKAALRVEAWLKEAAPSTAAQSSMLPFLTRPPELRHWFNHQPERWDEFQRRYRRELAAAGVAALAPLEDAARTGRRVTLVFSARDEARNNAVALRRILLERLGQGEEAGEEEEEEEEGEEAEEEQEEVQRGCDKTATRGAGSAAKAPPRGKAAAARSRQGGKASGKATSKAGDAALNAARQLQAQAPLEARQPERQLAQPLVRRGRQENPLFKPFQLGPCDLRHRIVLAPLTRCRAIDTIPHKNAITYYSQRASQGGLLLTEATCISERAHGYPHTPGIYTKEQQDGWRPVVELWHTGRASHPDYQPNGEPPVSASAIPITDGTQMVDFTTPRALEPSEIPGVVDEYRRAARASIDTGFDGVEIHGANGYLVDQFLKDESNQRTDEYGGSIERRCRFALKVARAVAEEVGPERTGIRLSPFGGFQNATDSHPYALVSYLLEELGKLRLAYVHMVEPRAGGNADKDPGGHTLEPFRKERQGWSWCQQQAAAFAHCATGLPCAEPALHLPPATAHPAPPPTPPAGHADLVAFGRYFLANPDLPLRFCLDAPLNRYHRETFYTQAGAHKGARSQLQAGPFGSRTRSAACWLPSSNSAIPTQESEFGEDFMEELRKCDHEP
eukprot:scaffold5.g665.t1